MLLLSCYDAPTADTTTIVYMKSLHSGRVISNAAIEL